MALVKERAKLLILVIMLALVPLRTLAALAMDPCSGHDEASLQANASHEHDPLRHAQHDDSKSLSPDHCASAAVAPFTALWPVIVPTASEHPAAGEPVVASFVPDSFDRPPLAL